MKVRMITEYWPTYRVRGQLGQLFMAYDIAEEDIYTMGTWLIAVAERDLELELLRFFYGDPCD